jgi:adenylosuccinate synthase
MGTNFRGQGIVVVGGQWGDEGKGRIVDSIAEHCDAVVRFQGGNNAGHSLHVGQRALVLHLIPCGIMRADKTCIIGNGVVIDLEVLFQEMDLLLKHDIKCTPDNLKVSKNAHVIFPYHKIIDAQRETTSSYFIGTTKRGIGPCYEDKIARFGIMAKDLLSDHILEKKLRNVFHNRQALLANSAMAGSMDKVFAAAREFGRKIAPFLCDTGEILSWYLKQGKTILFEGAQGALLDVDHGTYPYVTSSNCVAAQAAIGSGIGSNWLSEVLMVSKAYCTRVGEGPFFTEATDSEQELFRTLGNEFGATTGRPRRCGWLDLPALKYAARINGATGLVLTKIDILTGLNSIKIATSYAYKGKKLTFSDAHDLYEVGEKFDVHYEELPKIGPLPNVAHCLSDLPKIVLKLCNMIEKEVDLPIRVISYGQKRGQEFFITA